ncbi:MAG: phospholipase D-like domain-containing protein [Candidatus Babeliaceae bacterium]
MKRIFEKIIFVAIFCCITLLFLRVAHAFRQEKSEIIYAQQVLLGSDLRIKKALFSPDDKVKQVLIGLIEAEQKAIFLAAYTLTDKDIAQALLSAHQRGIAIEIIADGGKLWEQYSKIGLLCKEGIVVYSYTKKHKNMLEKDFYSSIMHNKFIIFAKTLNSPEPIVWTGSFNFTQSAAYKNQENVIVLQDAELAQAYRNQFEVLKDRCICLNKKEVTWHHVEKEHETPFAWFLKRMKVINF